jgi:pimeloyl-ACP methyl ester carboxylesterase
LEEGTIVMNRILFLIMVAASVQTPLSQTREEAVRLETPTGAIQGTLLLPANASARVPVALLIAGSGPTDRDGNTPLLPGKNNSLKLLAESLAAQGIASVRYDKRGIGASRGAVGQSESALRFTHFVDDASGWITQLRQDARFGRITVIGHSEGSLIGIMAAQKSPVDAVVSLAGAGRPIADILAEQLERGLPPETKPEAMRILNELRNGRTVTQVPPSLTMVFRPSVQPYLLSWLPIDPAAELAKLKVPVLIVQGSTDMQAMLEDARRLSQAHPSAKLVIIDGMNHVLKEVREASRQMASYSDPVGQHRELAAVIGGFVLNAASDKPRE